MSAKPNPFRDMPFPGSGGEYHMQDGALRRADADAIPSTADKTEPTQPAAAAQGTARRHRSEGKE